MFPDWLLKHRRLFQRWGFQLFPIQNGRRNICTQAGVTGRHIWVMSSLRAMESGLQQLFCGLSILWTNIRQQHQWERGCVCEICFGWLDRKHAWTIKSAEAGTEVKIQVVMLKRETRTRTVALFCVTSNKHSERWKITARTNVAWTTVFAWTRPLNNNEI